MLYVIVMEELIDALENRLEHGDDKESLRAEVVSAGHSNEVFEEAFLEASHRYAATFSSSKPPPAISASQTPPPPTLPNSRARGDLHTLEVGQLPAGSGLVGYIDMLRVGWRIGNDSLNILGGLIGSVLLLALLGGFILLAAGGMIQGVTVSDFSGMGPALLLIVVGYIFALLYITLIGFAVTRGILLRGQGVHFWPHFWWGWRRIISLFLLSFYIQIITNAGFVLLIIPGFIVMIYLGYSHYALIAEDKRGFDAMIRSFELVYGRFWSVVGRKIFLVVILGGLTAANAVLIEVFPLLGLLFSLVLLVTLYFILCSMIALFESLKSLPPVHVFSEQDRKSIKTWLRALVVAAIIFSLFTFFSIVRSVDVDQKYPGLDEVFGVTEQAGDEGGINQDEQASILDDEQNALIKSYMDTVPAIAEAYREETGSYAEVCSDEEIGVNTVLRYVYDSESSNIFCHDARGWYIAEAEFGDSEIYFCVDSKGNTLIQQQSRGDYETCLDEWRLEDFYENEEVPETGVGIDGG